MKELSVNLRKLLIEAEISESEFSRRVDIAQPIIHRILNKKNLNPKIATIKPIANYFNITISQLIGESPLFCEYNKSKNARMQKFAALPILAWDEIAVWLENPRKKIKECSKVITDLPISKLAYAVKITDGSMEPIFAHNTILVVEPEAKPENGRFIVVKRKKHSSASVRQLILDGETKYLKSLHSAIVSIAPMLMLKDDAFYGVVVQSRTTY